MTRFLLLTFVTLVSSYFISGICGQKGGGGGGVVNEAGYVLCKPGCVKGLEPKQCDQGCQHNFIIYDGPVFHEPPVLNDTEITLYVKEKRHTNKASNYVEFNSRAFVYGDNEYGIHGPTIIMRPGTNVTVTLINNLSPYAEGHTHTMNQMGDASTVNLHTHGLHIDPVIDNVFIRVEPGEEHVYHYELLPDHAPGLHWYHAHVHGSSKLHLMNGLLGAIWVPPLDSTLFGDLASAKSFVMVITHLKFTEKDDRYHQYLPGATEEPNGPASDFEDWSFTGTEYICGGNLSYSDTIYADNVSSGAFREFHLVNGLFQPVHTMLAGEIQIFNILYGSGSQMTIDFEIRTDVDGADGADGSHICDTWIISTDGVYKEIPRQLTGSAVRDVPGSGKLILVAAQRIGLAVQCNTPGTYYLMSIAPENSDRDSSQRFTQNLVTLKVDATSQSPMSMPSAVTSNAGSVYLNDLTSVTPDSHWEISASVYDKKNNIYELGMGSECTVGCEGEPGLCGGESPPDCCLGLPSMDQCYYTPFRGDLGDPTEPGWKGWYPHIGKLGTIEELVINGRGGGIHPLHVHVNHFQIMDYEGPFDFTPHFAIGDWRDTIPAISGRITVKYALHGFTGTVITHCHLLYHEDLGMMGSFYVVGEDVDLASIDNDVSHIRCIYDKHYLVEKELITSTNVNSAIAVMDKFFIYRTSLTDMRCWMSPDTTRAMSLGFQYLINNKGQSSVVDDLGTDTYEAVLNTLTVAQRDLLCDQIRATEDTVVALHQLRAELVSYVAQLIERSPTGAPSANEAYNETKDDDSVRAKIAEVNLRIHTLSAQLSLTYISGFNDLTLTNAQVQYLTSLTEGDYSLGDFNATGLCGSSISFAQTQLPEVGNELFAWIVLSDATGISYVDAPLSFGLEEPQQLIGSGVFGVEHPDALKNTGQYGLMGHMKAEANPNQGTCSKMRAYAVQQLEDEKRYAKQYGVVGTQLSLLKSESTANQFDSNFFTSVTEKLADRSTTYIISQTLVFRDALDSSENSLHPDYIQGWLEEQYGNKIVSLEKVDHIFDLCMGSSISNDDRRIVNVSGSFSSDDDFYGVSDDSAVYLAQVPTSCDEVAVGEHCNLNPPEDGDFPCGPGNVLEGTIRMVCFEFNEVVSWVKSNNSFSCGRAKPATFVPSAHPSHSPSQAPSTLTEQLTAAPSPTPSFRPVESPSTMPNYFPTEVPSFRPVESPSTMPNYFPTEVPSFGPVESPSTMPNYFPTEVPSFGPEAPSASGEDAYGDDGYDDNGDDNDDSSVHLMDVRHNKLQCAVLLVALYTYYM